MTDFNWLLMSARYIAFVLFGILFGVICGATVVKVPALELTARAAKTVLIICALLGGVAGVLLSIATK